jgi:chemotaxis response regulator CheB
MKVWLNLEPDLDVVGTADSGETAIEQVTALQPDVVLMDIPRNCSTTLYLGRDSQNPYHPPLQPPQST